MRRAALRAALVFALLSVCSVGRAAAGGEALGADTVWTAKKCRFYDKAWHELLDLSGRQGISDAFIAGNEAYIAAGCSNGADICPHSAQEGALANRLTMALMNFGTASTFLPFVCRGNTAPLKLQ